MALKMRGDYIGRDKWLWETKMMLFQGLMHKLSLKLQHRDSSSKSARVTWGGNKLTNFRARAAGVGNGKLSGTEALVGMPFFFC